MKSIKCGNRYIHEYGFGDKEVNYCIGLSADEVFIDEDEKGIFSLEDYQGILKLFGAKKLTHEFDYHYCYPKFVEDSYFDTVGQCENAIESLMKQEKLRGGE